MKINKNLSKGFIDGIPIGLGYFAVSFSLGIVAKKAGLSSIAGFFTSLFTRASAGEYAGYTMMLSNATYWETVLITIIANLRYLLMNTALTQKFDTDTPFILRILTGVCCTDEIFGISIAFEGSLDPLYTFGATLIAGSLWALGTTFGIIAGSILPDRIVSALSVALYGMFIAIVIPAAKKEKAVLFAVIISYVLSYLSKIIPLISNLSSGSRTIILTLLISAFIAWLKPVNNE